MQLRMPSLFSLPRDPDLFEMLVKAVPFAAASLGPYVILAVVLRQPSKVYFNLRTNKVA
jgi:hypothetical protein